MIKPEEVERVKAILMGVSYSGLNLYLMNFENQSGVAKILARNGSSLLLSTYDFVSEANVQELLMTTD